VSFIRKAFSFRSPSPMKRMFIWKCRAAADNPRRFSSHRNPGVPVGKRENGRLPSRPAL
jgi:hypothetical protein